MAPLTARKAVRRGSELKPAITRLRGPDLAREASGKQLRNIVFEERCVRNLACGGLHASGLARGERVTSGRHRRSDRAPKTMRPRCEVTANGELEGAGHTLPSPMPRRIKWPPGERQVVGVLAIAGQGPGELGARRRGESDQGGDHGGQDAGAPNSLSLMSIATGIGEPGR